MGRKSKKIRTEFRKNRSARARRRDWTGQYDPANTEQEDKLARGERISGKGELTRRRTVMGEQVHVELHAEPALLVGIDLFAHRRAAASKAGSACSSTWTFPNAAQGACWPSVG